MNCRCCDILLTILNTHKSHIARHDYICKICSSIKNKLWRESNKDVLKIRRGIYQSQHRDNANKSNRKYKHTLKGRLSSKKSKYKHRKLFSNPLNEYFINSDEHHITKELTIFLPQEIHKSIKHNIHTGKNINIINSYAYFFLMQQNIVGLSHIFL